MTTMAKPLKDIKSSLWVVLYQLYSSTLIYRENEDQEEEEEDKDTERERERDRNGLKFVYLPFLPNFHSNNSAFH